MVISRLGANGAARSNQAVMGRNVEISFRDGPCVPESNSWTRTKTEEQRDAVIEFRQTHDGSLGVVVAMPLADRALEPCLPDFDS